MAGTSCPEVVPKSWPQTQLQSPPGQERLWKHSWGGSQSLHFSTCCRPPQQEPNTQQPNSPRCPRALGRHDTCQLKTHKAALITPSSPREPNTSSSAQLTPSSPVLGGDAAWFLSLAQKFRKLSRQDKQTAHLGTLTQSLPRSRSSWTRCSDCGSL